MPCDPGWGRTFPSHLCFYQHTKPAGLDFEKQMTALPDDWLKSMIRYLGVAAYLVWACRLLFQWSSVAGKPLWHNAGLP